MTEREKMLTGMLYDPSDEELSKLLVKARKLARLYNQIDEDGTEKRFDVLRKLLPNTPNLPSLQDLFILTMAVIPILVDLAVITSTSLVLMCVLCTSEIM